MPIRIVKSNVSSEGPSSERNRKINKNDYPTSFITIITKTYTMKS